IFVSMPADQFNTNSENAFKWALMDLIKKQGFFPEVFFNPKTTKGLAASISWSPDAVERVLKQCIGAVLVGLPRWHFRDSNRSVLIATEYCQYEGALARNLNLPLLVFVQEGVLRRGVFDSNFGPYVTTLPSKVGASWIKSQDCTIALDKWIVQMKTRRDIFI